MSELSRPERILSPPSVAAHVDEVCDRFEAAWTAGERPRIEDYLGATPEPQHAALLQELVLLDVWYRRLAKENPQIQDYQAPFPGLDSAWLEGAVAATPAGDTGPWSARFGETDPKPESQPPHAPLAPEQPAESAAAILGRHADPKAGAMHQE